MKICLLRAEVDMGTDGHEAFRNFANPPKNAKNTP